jgi:hypothetical protein
MAASFPSSEWFKSLFGFHESVDEVRANFTVEVDAAGQATLTSAANGRSFNAGRFTVRNIPSFPAPPAVGGGKINVIKGAGMSGKLYLVDALASQSHESFDGATFLAASNFNCLEFVGPSQTAGEGVTGYYGDTTQGPYCALAAGAATVYRNYFAPHGEGAVGQLDQEVRLLKDTPIDPFVSHGYPQLRASDLTGMADHNWDDPDQFYVGVHENCEVTTTRGEGRSTFALAPPGRIVHHVYAAAFDFNGYVAPSDVGLAISKKLLAAEYRAAVLAAAELANKYPGRQGSNKLVLTFLGGGVFGNPKDMICSAMLEAKDLIVQSGLQVYIVCWSTREFSESFPFLREAVEETGGEVINAAD